MSKKEKNNPDFFLLVCCGILFILGLLVLSSVSSTLSQERFGHPFYFLRQQILFGLLPGLILGFLAYKINILFFKKWAPLFFIINVGLVGMIFIPALGMTFWGATRWLNLGIISLQPAEFLKLTFVLYLAAWLVTRSQNFATVSRVQTRQRIGKKFASLPKKNFSRKIFQSQSSELYSPNFSLFIFFVLLGLIGLFLIFQPNISTFFIVAAVGFLMYFASGGPIWHSILTAIVLLGGTFTLIKIAPYRLNRLLILLNPDLDPMGLGYQLKQSLIAIGSGGLFGLGLGMSRQKFGFLPQAISDTIFSIFAEETGFIGALFLVLLFGFFLWRGFRIIKSSSDKFSQLVALGICSWIFIQVFVNIGSLTQIIPPTGVPLPFLSHGGSHLIAELVGVGILLNLSKNID